MQQKKHTFPEIKVIMVSFDMLPQQDAGLMRMAHYDISRMKGVAKQRKAMSQCNAYRVGRSERQIRIDFLDTEQPEAKQIRMRFIYELAAPFR